MIQPAAGKSASSRIRDYLKDVSPDAEFTAVMLIEDLGITEGAASGFLHKAEKEGAIKLTGIEGKRRKYVVVDLSVLRIRETASIGSKVGRQHEGVDGAHRVATLLRSLADQVEEFHSDLASYSTGELLRELARRDRVASTPKEA